MAPKFDMRPASQQQWSWLLAIWLFLGGSGAGLFLLFRLLELSVFHALLSLGLVLAGGAFLLAELGNPQRVWRAVSRPGTSWLSRGVLFVIAFLVSGSLSVAPDVAVLPWPPAGDLATGMGWFAAFCALMIILYPGFFLAANRAIPFWNTAFVPALFLGYAFAGGSGIVLLALPVAAAARTPAQAAAAAAIGVNLVLFVAYLVTRNRAGGAARESVRRLSERPLGGITWFGVVLIGLALPLALILWLPQTAPAAGGAMLVGSLLFRYAVLRAGVYVPPALAEASREIGTLHRISPVLEREYAGMTGHAVPGE